MAGADGIFGTISGLPELKAELLALPDKLRRRALRNALAAGARVIQRAVRREVPVLDLTKPGSLLAYRKGLRKPGTVQRAVSVRTSKAARKAGNVGVFVNVRPAKGAARGARSYKDPFYWRFLDKGWNPASTATGGRGKVGKRQRRKLNASGAAKKVPGRFFMRAGAARLQEALSAFVAKIGPAIAKLNTPKAPPP